MADRAPVFATACCWVCHKLLRLPLHTMNLRALGCHTMHRKCFHEGVFEELSTSIVYLVQGNQAAERLSRQFEKRKIGDPIDQDEPEIIGPDRPDLE